MPSDLSQVAGVVIFGDDQHALLIHRLDDEDDEDATVYGISLIDREGSLLRALGVLEDEDAYQIVVGLIVGSQRKRREADDEKPD